MAGLREEVEGLNALDCVSFFQKTLQVTHLSCWVAGNVNDAAWPEGKELAKEVDAATFPRRIDENGSLFRREGDVGKKIFGGGCDEMGVLNPVCFSVPACPISGSFREFDPDNLLEMLGKRESKKTGTTIGVEEILLVGPFRLPGSMAGERFQNEGVVLEKIPGKEVELQVANFFRDGGTMVGLNPVLGCAKEKRGSFLIFSRPAPDVIPDGLKSLVDFVHRYRAVIDIHETGAAVKLEKADWEILSRFRALEVRGNL
jgi:hypothetical protein